MLKNWNCNKYLIIILPFLLYIGALVFPFSVAASNAAFGLAILLSLLSGQLIHGIRLMHQHYPLALYAITAYLSLMLLGLLWSHDVPRGLQVISHQWLWLILPTLIAAFATTPSLRQRFWWLLTIGLTLHLGLCVVQMTGWQNMHIMGGSSPNDATGYIGHIGFGFVYAIWAGWLLHWGYLNKAGYLRWGAWSLAAWAIIMIFAADGRSGYLVTVAIIIFLVWTHFIKGCKPLTVAISILVSIVLLSTLIVSNLDHPRLKWTTQNVQALLKGDSSQFSEPRIHLWIDAISIWQEHPIIGVGTGGYQQALKALATNSGYTAFHHPHQAYLLALLRWGPLGLLTLLTLLICLYRSHSKYSNVGKNQLSNSITSFQIIGRLTVIALIVQSLTSNAFEEHASLMMTMFALAIALSTTNKKRAYLTPEHLNLPTHTRNFEK